MDSIRKCLEIVRQKNVDTRQVDTVGFSVQGETLCLTDENGEIIGVEHC